MRIGIVGGVEGAEPQLRSAAVAAGHEVEFHTGHVNSRATDRLRGLVERADLVVIVTSVNSHGAVLMARALARRSGRPTRFVRRLGPTQLRALVN
jgi:Uncharacterized protein conserved in bacteria (DUF2325)